MKTIDQIIDEIILIEAGYVDHPDDSGGPTNYGITFRVLREVRPNATKTDLINLDIAEARQIYKQKYFKNTNIFELFEVSPLIGTEVFDAAINMGPGTAIKFIQRALNVLNRKSTIYKDVNADGVLGSDTKLAMKQYIASRGSDGVDVLYKTIVCLRGARYVEIAEKSPKNESFIFGWIKNRINIRSR